MSDSTQIQTALFALLDVFRSAASSGDSDHSTLNRIELHDLIQSQLPFLMHENFDEQFEAFFKCVEDKSGSNVDFKEFMCLLATIVMCSKNRP